MQNIHFDGKLDYMIDNISFVNVLRNSNFTFPFRAGKEKYTLVFVENGELNYFFTQNRTNLKLTKGSFLFIPKHTPYIATYTHDDTITKVIMFDIISNSLPEIFNSPIYKNETFLGGIFKTLSNQAINSPIFLASKIYEILYIIEKESIVVPHKYKKIIPVLNEIQKFYFKNQKLSYYSDMCHMSESNFRKLFKEYTGKTPIEYRNIIRISEARKMIDSGEYSVQEAAYLTGFNNMSFFYELYKNI